MSSCPPPLVVTSNNTSSAVLLGFTGLSTVTSAAVCLVIPFAGPGSLGWG